MPACLVFTIVVAVAVVLLVTTHSTEPQTAILFHCSQLPKPASGDVHCNSTNENISTVCTFSCNKNYRMKTESGMVARNTTLETKCVLRNSTAQWTQAVPFCEKVTECGALTAPVGITSESSCTYEATDTSLTSGTTYTNMKNGTKCNFRCAPERSINGSDHVMCYSDGQWSPATPQCVLRPNCSHLPKPVSGDVHCNSTNYNINTVCTFSCKENYQLKTGSGTIAGRTTQDTECVLQTFTAQWTQAVPFCERVTECGALTTPVGITSESSCTYEATGTSLTSGTTYTNMKNGTRCDFRCAPERSINGSNHVMCYRDGQWSPATPQCVLRPSCPKLDDVTHSTHHCSNGSNVGSTCAWACTDTRILKGSANSTCTAAKRWSNPVPTCQCPTCTTGDKCQYTTSWNNLKWQIDISYPFHRMCTVNFAGRDIICKVNKHRGAFSIRFDCTCRKTTTFGNGEYRRCENYSSQSGACEHALAALLRQTVAQGKYPAPCDVSSMVVGCT